MISTAIHQFHVKLYAYKSNYDFEYALFFSLAPSLCWSYWQYFFKEKQIQSGHNFNQMIFQEKKSRSRLKLHKERIEVSLIYQKSLWKATLQNLLTFCQLFICKDTEKKIPFIRKLTIYPWKQCCIPSLCFINEEIITIIYIEYSPPFQHKQKAMLPGGPGLSAQGTVENSFTKGSASQTQSYTKVVNAPWSMLFLPSLEALGFSWVSVEFCLEFKKQSTILNVFI